MAKRANANANAADAANVNDAANDAATPLIAAPDAALESTPIMANDANATPLADAAAIAPHAAINVEIDSLLNAIALVRESAPDAIPALQDRLDTAYGKLALAEANAKLDAEKTRQLDAANAAAAASGLDADTLALMLAAIERKYAPVEPTPLAAPDADADAPRRLPVSDRTIAANAAALADSGMQARAEVAIAAFDADSGKLQCKVNRRPNTRFSGMVALAPSGDGVANAADYDSLTRAIRAYLIHGKGWQTSDNDGQTVPESKWLAARGRYVLGGGVKSALDCFHSDAEIALYADGRFRFAYRSTPNVRFLRTDNAAWTSFVSGRAAAPLTPIVPTPPTVSTPPTRPTPPSLPQVGSITPSARCQHCQARNVLTDAECDSCGAMDWRIA